MNRQIALDAAAVFAKLVELDGLKKLVKEQWKTIEALKEMVTKSEADAGVTEAGLHIIANALELHGILLAGEPTKPVAKPEPTREPWDPAKIVWIDATGGKGPYQKSQDINNVEFKVMLEDLVAHKGKLSRGGFFYWVFTNGSVVGRKQKLKRG